MLRPRALLVPPVLPCGPRPRLLCQRRPRRDRNPTRLAAERTEVEELRATKTRLEQRLAVSTSLEATRREARRIGYVRPGERLFIVKGIPAWRKARRSLGRHG